MINDLEKYISTDIQTELNRLKDLDKDHHPLPHKSK